MYEYVVEYKSVRHQPTTRALGGADELSCVSCACPAGGGGLWTCVLLLYSMNEYNVECKNTVPAGVGVGSSCFFVK